MKKSSLEAYLFSTLGVLAVFAIVVGFNVVTSAVKTRVDLTKEKAYTLSAGTRAILKKLDTPIKVRFSPRRWRAPRRTPCSCGITPSRWTTS